MPAGILLPHVLHKLGCASHLSTPFVGMLQIQESLIQALKMKQYTEALSCARKGNL